MILVIRHIALSVCTLLSAALATAAQAQWELDAGQSRVAFVSVKNAAIGEVHRFTSLVGFVGEDGHAQLSIDLDSVETAIPIRNQRMRELLFETASFPAANISTQLDPAVLASASEGTLTIDASLAVEMHGKTVNYSVPLVIDIDNGGNLQVTTQQPMIVNAADFDLAGGVGVLQEVAGLASISTAVPVTVQLLFRRAGTASAPAG